MCVQSMPRNAFLTVSSSLEDYGEFLLFDVSSVHDHMVTVMEEC